MFVGKKGKQKQRKKTTNKQTKKSPLPLRIPPLPVFETKIICNPVWYSFEPNRTLASPGQCNFFCDFGMKHEISFAVCRLVITFLAAGATPPPQPPPSLSSTTHAHNTNMCAPTNLHLNPHKWMKPTSNRTDKANGPCWHKGFYRRHIEPVDSIDRTSCCSSVTLSHIRVRTTLRWNINHIYLFSETR